MRAAYVSSALEDIPVDFFGDPDGCWDYDQLAQIAGFDQAWGQLSIGALTEPYSGFPDGAAVVMFTSADECVIALIDCAAVNDEHRHPGEPEQRQGEPAYSGWASASGQALGRADHVADRRRNDVAA